MEDLNPIIWPLILLIAGCGLAMLEVFIPSGGILGFLAAACAVAAISMAFFRLGPSGGFAFTAATVALVPVLWGLALKVWPHTPMGRRFLLSLPSEDEVAPEFESRLRDLVGKRGVAASKMLPSGSIRIDRRTYDAVTQGEPVDVGESVEVVEVRGFRVVVRPVDESDHEPSSRSSEDVLSRPLDELGIEPIDDPLA